MPTAPAPPTPAAPSIHTEPIITKLLDKVPADMRGRFSPDQLLALKVALGGRTWGAHGLDLRWTLKLCRVGHRLAAGVFFGAVGLVSGRGVTVNCMNAHRVKIAS